MTGPLVISLAYPLYQFHSIVNNVSTVSMLDFNIQHYMGGLYFINHFATILLLNDIILSYKTTFMLRVFYVNCDLSPVRPMITRVLRPVLK